MQFIPKGPDVPNQLLQDHEDGKVVFFCGAGISIPAGLPGFGKLVKKLYQELSETQSDEEKYAIKLKKFDTAIHLLEGRLTSGRERVREKLHEILVKNKKNGSVSAIHESLLELAKDQDGKTRLITTNFDRLFENVISERKLNVKTFQCPFLPIPKNRWDGLVYLHGLLKPQCTQSCHDHLVLSSGDFGLAYLAERWAARFIVEVFRSYTVCFVGYSVDDPVMRYVVDALAADSLRGEKSVDVYAFAPMDKNDSKEVVKQWKVKNIKAIVYNKEKRHKYLHDTLRVWGNMHQNGIQCKISVVSQFAGNEPQASTVEDNFVGRVVWAISDKSGKPAEAFANHSPTPSLKWFYEFEKDEFLGKSTISNKNFGLFKWKYFDEPLDNIGAQLAKWLSKHVGNEELLLLIAGRADRIHKYFLGFVIDELKKDGLNGKNLGGNSKLKLAWEMVINDRIRINSQSRLGNGLLTRIKNEGINHVSRKQLIEELSPCLKVSRGYSFKQAKMECEGKIEYKVVLAPHFLLDDLKHYIVNSQYDRVLHEIIDILVLSLKDFLDLSCDFGEVSAKQDLSYVRVPSISDHDQNMPANDFSRLVLLVRDAWLRVVQIDPGKALMVARQWMEIPYPVFRRLAYFAAAQTDPQVIFPTESVAWLLQDEAWWLWSPETLREVMRLLVAVSPNLNKKELKRLESKILNGPPRDMFKEDIEDDSFVNIKQHSIWLRLKKMEKYGAAISHKSRSILENISINNPEFVLKDNDRDEFSFFMSDGASDQFYKPIPDDFEELVSWLKNRPSKKDYWNNNEWEKCCRENYEFTSKAVLEVLNDKKWPQVEIAEALHVWAQEKTNLLKTWETFIDYFIFTPNENLDYLQWSFGHWLGALVNQPDGNQIKNDERFFKISNLIFENNRNDDYSFLNDPLTHSLNSAVGYVVQAGLSLWLSGSLKDNQGLSEDAKRFFSPLCDTQVTGWWRARLFLAREAITLYRVDPDWTQTHVLPLFSWKNPQEAKIAWSGFLWSPRIYYPILHHLKRDFLLGVENYNLFFSDIGRQYSTFLTLVSLVSMEHGKAGVFEYDELRDAFSKLPDSALDEVSSCMLRMVNENVIKPDLLWNSRLEPFINRVFPKENRNLSDDAILCLYQIPPSLDQNFSDAINALKPFFRPIQDSFYYKFEKLRNSIHPEYHPEDSLLYLSVMIDRNNNAPLNDPIMDLKDCLNRIKNASPNLSSTSEFRRLSNLLS